VALAGAQRWCGEGGRHWGGNFDGPGGRSMARWFSRTGARETGGSEEGGPCRAAVIGIEELAAVTH
jgi:hypothetical protein